MPTSVGAPRAFVLICATICFAETDWLAVGVCKGCVKWCAIPLLWREFNFQLQIGDATKLWSVWDDQKLAMKAKTERSILYYLCYSNIIAKREVV